MKAVSKGSFYLHIVRKERKTSEREKEETTNNKPSLQSDSKNGASVRILELDLRVKVLSIPNSSHDRNTHMTGQHTHESMDFKNTKSREPSLTV